MQTANKLIKGSNVIPFRFARRIPQIQKTASYMATLDPQHAEGHLRDQLRRLEESLRKKGVAGQLIRAEIASYEGAVRAELWRLIVRGGAA